MAPADSIIASPGSLIGSIGVMFGPLRYYDGVVAIDGGILGGGVSTTGGIEEFYISAGRSKDIGNPYRNLTEEERRSLQETVDVIYERFVEHVAKNRQILETDVKSGIGAFIYEASRAAELGLVDELGDARDAWDTAARKAKLDNYDVRYEAPISGLISALFGALANPEPINISGLCTSSPQTFVYHGDLGSFCSAAMAR